MSSQSPHSRRHLNLMELKAPREDADRRKEEARRNTMRTFFANPGRDELGDRVVSKKRRRENADDMVRPADVEETESVPTTKKQRVDDVVTQTQDKLLHVVPATNSSVAAVQESTLDVGSPRTTSRKKKMTHVVRSAQVVTVAPTNRTPSANVSQISKVSKRMPATMPQVKSTSPKTTPLSLPVDEEDVGPVIAKASRATRKNSRPSRADLEHEYPETLESRRNVNGYQGNARLSKNALDKLARTKARQTSTSSSASERRVSDSSNGGSRSSRTTQTSLSTAVPSRELGTKSKTKVKGSRVVKKPIEARSASLTLTAAANNIAAKQTTLVRETKTTIPTVHGAEGDIAPKKRTPSTEAKTKDPMPRKSVARTTSIQALYHSLDNCGP